MNSKLTDPSLKQSDRNYRHIIYSMEKGWVYHKIVTDAENKPVDYVFLEVNKAFECLTGLTKEKIIGKRVTEVLPNIKNDPVDWIGRYGKVALSGIPASFENYSESLDRWYTVSATCPEPGYFAVVIDDITERRQLEKEHHVVLEKLRHSHDLMQYIISHAWSAIAVHDRDLNYVFVSDRYLREHKVVGQDLIGKHHYEVFPNFPQKLRAVHQRCLKGEVLSAEEDFYVRVDGSTDWSRWECRPWYESDNSIGGIIVYTEIITQRKQQEEQRLKLEQQLRQKHKMEAVGYMAGGMAHNFNNNLSIILGNIELSQLKVQDSKVQEFLKNAKTAILRSRDLVSQIITYSRKGTQNKAPMKLLTIVDETITLLRSTLPTTINLQKTVSPACKSALLNVDPSQIQEILVNLCNNAAHAMNEEGGLTISLEPVELSQTEIPAQYDGMPGPFVKLSVEDNGCGIPAEILDKIFDPFFTTKEIHEGTGMGLATVQGIVAQHGGIIKVNSIPAQGTVFDLYFPRIDKTISETNPTNKDMPKGTEKILLVDDDEMLAKLGKLTLSEMGYQVVSMTKSTEALKLFSANPDHFDLVITDQTMPGLTGKDLIHELKKIRVDTPTILCTGYSSKIDKEQAQQHGIDAFCMKPIDLLELLQTVRQVLDGSKE